MKYRPVSYPGLVAGADWNGFSVRHYIAICNKFSISSCSGVGVLVW
jgi:hypothetical protein